MTKYPFVLFFRYDKYSNIDNYFIENNLNLDCSLIFTSNKEDLNKLFNSSYQILITYGATENEYLNDVMSFISERMRYRWIHIKEEEENIKIDQFNYMINYCFINNCFYEREKVRPIFSVFTTTYNSYEKILRVYDSLKIQTLKDWEWVVLDDSPDDEHFKFLKELMLKDHRIRLYKRGENSGNIGNVKNEAVSLCRGKYVLEMDHDDILLPYVLQDSTNVFDKNEEIGFIYMDCISLYENGENHTFEGNLCKGYGAYYWQMLNNKWVNVYLTPNINNITLSHLCCCPNHPRIWRKDLLIKIGNYSEFLPICDDYEIILRTAVSTKIAKIHKVGYIQVMNESNNNFSLIRNAEINRIGPYHIYPQYFEKFDIHNKMKLLDAYEDEKYIYINNQIWENDDSYVHKFCNLIINLDYDFQYCIIGINSLILNLDRIKELYLNPRNDFILLESKCDRSYLFSKLNDFDLNRFKCYAIVDASDIELERYFKLLYKSCDNYEIINKNINHVKYNTDNFERYLVINNNSNPTDKYLEIGVETGFTYEHVHFNDKQGVDPDPKCSSECKNILKKTSDEFFYDLEDNINVKDNEDYCMDVVFIDGLHQSEQVVNDINNSIKILRKGGKIFMDDILPLTYHEQLKIPIKHYYENDILKYGESWTGDVWKVLYHILKYFSHNIVFSYFAHANYRGVALLKINSKFCIEYNDIDIINNYTYEKDFNDYIELIHKTE